MTNAADADSEELEKFQRRQDMMRCPGCGEVADARMTFTTSDSITNIHKRWVTVHRERTDGGEDEFYFHFDESEVDRGAELRNLLAADEGSEEVDHREPRAHDRENLDEYTRTADRTGREPRTDGGEPHPRIPITLREDARANVHDSERCDGAGSDPCIREDAELIRGEDEIHVTNYGPGHSKSGRRVLCGGCRDKQNALNIADNPDLAGLYQDELADLRERFPDILADVDIPMTDGGGDWTEQYATTTYRGPQKYPVPGAWVLGIVEGDGIGWKHYPDTGEGLSLDSEVADADPDLYFEGPETHARLTVEYPEDADVLEDTGYHELAVGGEVVLVLKDASEVDESEWWSAIAEALARYDSDGDVETVLADLGMEHLKADPFGAREEADDGDGGDHSLDEFATDGGQIPHTTPEPPWIQLAQENVQKWGLQSTDALLLAMGEEMGELSREVLTWNEHADEGRRAEQGRDLIRRMADLGDDIQEHLETVSEDANGEPIPEDERPNYLTPCESLNDSLANRRTTGELSDMMALGYQFWWALEREDCPDE